MKNGRSGELSSGESKDDKGFDMTISIDTGNSGDDFSTTETIIHEGLLEADYLAKDFAKDGKLNYDNISNYVKKDWLQGDISNYNHAQNFVDRRRVGGENLLWPGTGYRILQEANKNLGANKTNEQIQSKMSGFVGFYGKLFGKF